MSNDQDNQFLAISPLFETSLGDNSPENNASNHLYGQLITHILGKILPQNVFSFSEHGDPEEIKKQFDFLHSLFPLLRSTVPGSNFKDLSFFVLTKGYPTAIRFFFEMISNWLIPGKRLNILLVHSANFRFSHYGSTIYTVCEIKAQVDTLEEYRQIERNLPALEAEIRLGMSSQYYARRILETKGLSLDEKTVMIQEYITYLLRRLPHIIDKDILTEMQHVLVMCREDFKIARNYRHLSRMISTCYLFRRALHQAIKKAPAIRHLRLKLFKTTLQRAGEEQPVLAVVVGVNFLKEKEIFEQRHLLNAIQNYVPDAKAVENSFFTNRLGSEPICTLYLEIMKGDGAAFSAQEIQFLKKELSNDLKDRIEQLMHPVFMPRNEEEIMRNILSLNNQIKFLKDLPQVFISFDEQTHSNLFFTIILVRIMRPGGRSLQELFKNASSPFQYIHDRARNVGYIRKKYIKEATVFRLKLPKEPYLRRDHSINLYKARHSVVNELYRIIGEFRDFNGGMISKQHEMLNTVKELLSGDTRYNELLLENFFYSLNPVSMRSVLEPQAFAKLFEMLLERMEKSLYVNDHYDLELIDKPSFVFALLKSPYRVLKDEVMRVMGKLSLENSMLAHAYVQIYDLHYSGYIFRSDDPANQHIFRETLHQTILTWEQKKSKASALSLHL